MRETFSREKYREFLVSRMQLPGLEGCQIRMVHSWLLQRHGGGSLPRRLCFKQKTDWKYNYDHLNHYKVIMMMLITVIVFNKDSVPFSGWEGRPVATTVENDKFVTNDGSVVAALSRRTPSKILTGVHRLFMKYWWLFFWSTFSLFSPVWETDWTQGTMTSF